MPCCGWSFWLTGFNPQPAGQGVGPDARDERRAPRYPVWTVLPGSTRMAALGLLGRLAARVILGRDDRDGGGDAPGVGSLGGQDPSGASRPDSGDLRAPVHETAGPGAQ